MKLIEKMRGVDQDLASAALLKRLGQRYQNSIFMTAKDLCGYEHMTGHTHGAMCGTLESVKRKKLIVMPRGTFKSSVGVVAFSIWLLINDPNLRILIDSEKYENSKNFIHEIKGKLEDPRIVKLFGQFKSDDKWAEGAITIKQRTKVFKEASVTASGINAGKTGQHYDVIIHDDLNTEENSQNPDQRRKIIRHYQMNTSILEPGGIIVVIGTRYATDDLIGWIMDNEIKPRAA